MLECDKQIQQLEQRAQAQKPWGARVQAATAIQKAAEARFAAAETDLKAARAAVIHFEQEQRQAQEALEEANVSLATVRSEGAQPTSHTSGLTPSAVSAALTTLASAAGAGGDGATSAVAQLVAQLRELVCQPHDAGADAVALAAGMAVESAGLGVGAHLGAGGPRAEGPAERPSEDDLPTQLMSAVVQDSWQEVLRRVPHGPAAQGPQATLDQWFQWSGKGGSKGGRSTAEAPGPY